jgi:prolyl 4-hydroxylase
MQQEISNVDTEAPSGPSSMLPEVWWEWLNLNVRRGCSDTSMLADLLKGGFDLGLAQRALVTVRAGARLSTAEPDGTAIERPLPRLLPQAACISVDGVRVRVRMRVRSPDLALLDDVLSESECNALIELGSSVAKPSSVVDPTTGSAVEHGARSGTHGFLLQEDPVLARIEKRLSLLLNWPLDRFENLQLIGYGPGDEYRPHFDWFDPSSPGSAAHLATAGQRVGTLVMYLQEPESGGGTCFPTLGGLEALPQRGSAVWFRDVDAGGQPDPLTLHAGDPVRSGLKWIATAWLRERTWRMAGP